eukprot:GFYU01001565.1.p2 GENE.GFYU01001565.1~~GFYU01001565.1.p2  ORF type:complete len:219 (-),score=46.90 GFYU01001565.1:1847-2503(-)
MIDDGAVENIDAQYKVAKKLAFEIHGQLEKLETGKEDSTQAQGSISSNINSLIRSAQTLEGMVYHEPPIKREQWRRKIAALIEESEQLRTALERFLNQLHVKAVEQQEREQLLGIKANDKPALFIDSYAKEEASLKRSNQMVDDLTSQGAGILSMLNVQGEQFKRAHRRVLDISHSLGLSQDLIRLIERRGAMDKIILVVGMIVCLLITYIAWTWKNS